MDFDIYFDQEYRNTLHEVQNVLQENVTYNIQDEVESFKFRKFSPKTFPDVGYAVGKKRILFKNITLLTELNINLEKFEVDFKNQSLYFNFKFARLQVSTEYELSSSDNGDSANHNGNVKFNFIPSASGRVGIFFTQDSFSPVTYDLQYDIADLQLETSPEESMELFNLDPKNSKPIETKLISLFWPALKDFLHYEIYRLVSGNVVEYSVDELLLNEPERLKKYAEERCEHGNVFMQHCLNDFNTILEKQSNFKSTETFFLKLLNDNAFRCSEAKLLQPSLKKTYNTTYANDGNEEYYCTHVCIDNYQYGFLNSVIKTESDSFEGDVIVKPHRNKILFKVVVCNGRKLLSIELLDIIDWNFEVVPKNDGVLKFVEDELRPYFVGYIWHHTDEILQTYKEQFNAD